jgi:hypothetical protein
MAALFARSSWTSPLAYVHSAGSLLFVIGVILVICCLAGAAYMAYLRNALGAVLLLIVAVVAAFLLL